MGYLRVHGREAISPERQTFRFQFEILDVSKMFVSDRAAVPGWGQGGRQGRPAPPTAGHQLITALLIILTCVPLNKAATPTIRSPHTLAARALGNISLPSLLEKVDVLCGCKVSEITI